MKWVLIVLGALVALVLVVVVIGLLRPKSHVATHAVVLDAPPERVWAVITDFPRQVEWVPDISKVEPAGERNGQPQWRETFSGFAATTVVTAFDTNRRLVKEILPTGPFYGSWTWELVPEGTGTRLTITERGTVDNPFFRGMMIFHDNTKSAREYAEALDRRLRQQ